MLKWVVMSDNRAGDRDTRGHRDGCEQAWMHEVMAGACMVAFQHGWGMGCTVTRIRQTWVEGCMCGVEGHREQVCNKQRQGLG